MISVINTVLGLAMVAAPFVFGYSDNTNALWSSVILGAIVALASGYKAMARDTKLWEDGVDVVAGIVAVLLPIGFGFGAATAAFWASVVIGIGVVALAGFEIYDTNLQAS